MLSLHQFAPAFGVPNASPFCLKVESYLRLADIDYEIALVTDPRKGPHGKAPWIVDDGKIIADSRFILDHLNQKHGFPLQSDLDPSSRAPFHALQRMFEESTYFVLLFERWIVLENAELTREALFAPVPAPLRKLIFAIAHRGVKKALLGQGTGRLSRDEVIRLGKQDIDCAAAFLGKQRYFGGEMPGEIDTVAFATLANLVKAPISSPVSDYIRKTDNLVAYTDHMMNKLFPEFTKA